MSGALILVVVMVLVGPMMLFGAGIVWSALIGQALEADRRAAGVTPGAAGQ